MRDAEILALKVEQRRAAQRTAEQFVGVFSAISRVETKVDRILDGIQIGAIAPAPPPSEVQVSIPQMTVRRELPSLNWDPDEDTGQHELPVWAQRARDAASAQSELRARLAAAQATIQATEEERKRQSIRAAKLEDRRWSKWQKIAGIVIAVLTALGGGVGLSQLFR